MATNYDFQSAHVTSFLVCLLDGLQTMQNLFPVQIENVLSAHPAIREAAVVSVPDAKYGEVVGAWIVLEPGKRLARAEVRKVVWEGMNPQVRVRLPPQHADSDVTRRMHLRGYGSSARAAVYQKSCPRRRVGR